MPLRSSEKYAVTNTEVCPASMFNESELRRIEINDGGVWSADNSAALVSGCYFFIRPEPPVRLSPAHSVAVVP
jgi:hypothetical protein